MTDAEILKLFKKLLESKKKYSLDCNVNDGFIKNCDSYLENVYDNNKIIDEDELIILLKNLWKRNNFNDLESHLSDINYMIESLKDIKCLTKEIPDFTYTMF